MAEPIRPRQRGEPGIAVPQEVSLGDSRLRVDPGDHWIWGEATQGRWEPETLGVVRQLTTPGDLIIDVGAHYGVVTALGASLGATVHAFEPDPVARSALERMLALNPELRSRVTVHSDALGGQDRWAKLSSERLGNSGASLCRDQPDTVTVRVRDAALLVELGLENCRLLKLDAEGAEYEILPRLLRHLRTSATNLVLSIHTYQFREPFRGWPRLARGIAYRSVALPRQARLMIAAMRLGPAYIAEPNSGRWYRLRARRLLGALVQVGEKEILVLSSASVQ